MDQCVRYYVSGRVQGVFFRASTQRHALALDLSGWVCNLNDGRVEVNACGSVQALEALGQWLKKGPDQADVEEVVDEVIEQVVVEGFKIR